MYALQTSRYLALTMMGMGLSFYTLFVFGRGVEFGILGKVMGYSGVGVGTIFIVSLLTESWRVKREIQQQSRASSNAPLSDEARTQKDNKPDAMPNRTARRRAKRGKKRRR